VTEAAVFGLLDPEFGERVCAAVVRADPALTAEAIVEHCRAQLAGYKKPKRVFFVEALPRNAMGKVQKHTLVDGFTRS
jgi:malonyl-CoA/methylmalonyl-CoA synthetase